MSKPKDGREYYRGGHRPLRHDDDDDDQIELHGTPEEKPRAPSLSGIEGLHS